MFCPNRLTTSLAALLAVATDAFQANRGMPAASLIRGGEDYDDDAHPREDLGCSAADDGSRRNLFVRLYTIMAGMTPLAPAAARADSSSSNPPVDELETISRKLDAILQELAINEKKSTVNEEQLITDESSRGESRDVKTIKETEGIMTRREERCSLI